MENTRQDTHGALAVENGLGKKSLEGFFYYTNRISITLIEEPTETFFSAIQSLKGAA